MYCSQCGTPIQEGAKFCSSCGSSSPAEAGKSAPASNQLPTATDGSKSQSQRAANASLYLGIAAIIAGNLVVLSFSWLVPALVCCIGGVIWGVLGVRYAQRTAGEGARRSRVGLTLSGLALISLASWGFLVSTGQNIVFDKAGVEKQMVDWLGETYVAPTSVDCPETPTMKEGNTFECIANFSDSSTATIYVKVQDTSGNITFGTSPQ